MALLPLSKLECAVKNSFIGQQPFTEIGTIIWCHSWNEVLDSTSSYGDYINSAVGLNIDSWYDMNFLLNLQCYSKC